MKRIQSGPPATFGISWRNFPRTHARQQQAHCFSVLLVAGDDQHSLPPPSTLFSPPPVDSGWPVLMGLRPCFISVHIGDFGPVVDGCFLICWYVKSLKRAGARRLPLKSPVIYAISS